jgi:methylmalonyl-CoA epimerase
MALLPIVSLDHVGIASSSEQSPLADAVAGEPLRGTLMPSGVTVAHFGPDDLLELVWPGPEGSPIDKFLERRGPGLHHIALRVDGPLGEIVERLKEAGLRTTGEIERSADGRWSVFLHPSSTGGVLIELVEGARP